MKRFLAVAACTALLAIPAATAHAGVLSGVRGWLTAETLALALTAALTILGGLFGAAFGKVRRTFTELGEFLTALGEAVQDSRITRDELAILISEGRDVVNTWRR